jgi:hypothetical protein
MEVRQAKKRRDQLLPRPFVVDDARVVSARSRSSRGFRCSRSFADCVAPLVFSATSARTWVIPTDFGVIVSHLQNRKGQHPLRYRPFGVINPGGDLRSHTVTSAVSSAQRGLTSVFGMGTGVTPAAWPPGKWKLELRKWKLEFDELKEANRKFRKHYMPKRNDG